MTKQERDKLRELTLAATPGEWEQKNTTDVFGPLAGDSGDGTKADLSDGWLIADCNVGLTSVNGELATMDVKAQRRNAAYIAAANPATVLALLDMVDELEGDAELPEIKTIGRAKLRVNRINNLEPPTERAVPEGYMKETRELRVAAFMEALTVSYDVSAANTESAIREKLIELGWTPPGLVERAVPEITGDTSVRMGSKTGE